MPVVFKNLTQSLLIVNLNTVNLRLSPGAVSNEVNDVELKDNAKVAKLLSKRAIAVETRTPAPTAKSEAAAPAAEVAPASESAAAPGSPDAAAASKKTKPSA